MIHRSIGLRHSCTLLTRGSCASTIWHEPCCLLAFPIRHSRQMRKRWEKRRRIGHRNSLALPLFFGGVIRQILGDREGVKLRAAELAQISGEAGFRFWQAGATILQAWAVADEGETERGRADLQRGVSEWRSTGAQYMSPYFAALLAQIELKAGDPAAALRLLEGAQEVIERTNERWFAAEVLRLQGEAMLQLGPDQGKMAAERFRRRAGHGTCAGCALLGASRSNGTCPRQQRRYQRAGAACRDFLEFHRRSNVAGPEGRANARSDSRIGVANNNGRRSCRNWISERS